MTTITLDLTAIAHGGEALGHHAEKVVFVPYALPGERVRARIVEERARWARAELLEVMTISEDRVEPPCPYFGPGLCGGCQWQHVAYPRQLALKQEIVVDQLRRLGRIADPPVQPTLPADAPLGYLCDAHLTVGPQGQLGLLRTDGREVIPIDRCLLLHPLLDELHGALQLGDEEEPAAELAAWLAQITLRASVASGERLLIFEGRAEAPPELEVDLPVSCAFRSRSGRIQPLIGRPYLEEQVAGRVYRVSAASPFPANPAGAELLIEATRRLLDPQPDDLLLDVSCGVGLLGLALSDAVGMVVGIEENADACDDFAWNARDLDAARVALHEGPAAEVLAALAVSEEGLTSRPADLAIITPPRPGVGEEALRALAALGPRRIVYVSFDPAALARDATTLQDGGYRLAEVQPIDLFPQMARVASVSRWDKVG